MDLQPTPTWQPGPNRPRLAEATIDIWLIDLQQAPGSGNQLDEARTAMRDILGGYAGRPVTADDIARSPGGKPFLDIPGRQPEFNLSHTRDIALLAVAGRHRVGIDIEHDRVIRDPLRLARRILSPTEIAELECLPPGPAVDRFLQMWTGMEARQKALGRGIFAGPVDPAEVWSLAFTPLPGFTACLAASPPDDEPTVRFYRFAPS